MKIFLFITLFALAGVAQAQTYPNKPIRLVVPFAPGGSSTIVARSVAAEMEFVGLAKAKPGELYYGSAGNGSAGHLAMAYLKLMSGMNPSQRSRRGGRKSSGRPA